MSYNSAPPADVVVVKSKDTSIRHFVLAGHNSVKEKITFTNADDARKNYSPFCANLLVGPYFQEITLQSYKGHDCLSIKLVEGRSWDTPLSNGPHSSTLETLISNKISKNMGGRKLISDGTPTEGVEEKIRTWLEKNKPDIVVQHGGDVELRHYDKNKKMAVVAFVGACASAASCQGSQSATKGQISQNLQVEYPNDILTVQYTMEPNI